MAGQVHYCASLLQDNFDRLKQNVKQTDDNISTPYSLAKYRENGALLSQFAGIRSDGSSDEEKTGLNSGGNHADPGGGAATLAIEAVSGIPAIYEIPLMVFKNNISFSKYFLHTLGIDTIESDTSKFKLDKNKNMQNNEFFYDITQFEGLRRKKRRMSEWHRMGGDILSAMVDVLIELLTRKCPINEGLLVVCFEYCITSKNQSMVNNLLRCLRSCVQQYIESSRKVTNNINNNSGNNSNENKENDKKKGESIPPIKAYDAIWFEENLLNSNVWYEL